MRQAEAVWWRIIGVLLILVGALLLANPRVNYSKSQQIPQTKYSVSTPKILVVPRVVAGLIVAAGLATLAFTGSSARRS
jgi:uncharacterized membrane protein YidH (DUF202 family)